MKEKKEKQNFPHIFNETNEVSTNLLNFIDQKAISTKNQTHESMQNSAFYRTYAIRMSEICQKVKERKEKQNFRHIFNERNEEFRGTFLNFIDETATFAEKETR